MVKANTTAPSTSVILLKVDRSGGPNACWPWTGPYYPNGYGCLAYKLQGKRISLLAHRVIWEITNGSIPSGKKVLHRCDNPPCCNPAHLFAGTSKDNSQDMATKGRQVFQRNPGKVRRGAMHGVVLHPESVKRGEDVETAKLNEKMVGEIRVLFSSGEKRSELAIRFNVGWTTINNVVTRKTWKHVP